MSPYYHRVLLLFAIPLILFLISGGTGRAEGASTQYLLFQIFTGALDPSTGVYRRLLAKSDLPRIVRHIAETLRPATANPHRRLGFAVGPIAMDEGEEEARSVVRDAFDVALQTDMAVALHLDDYMFWARARWPDGRLLREARDSVEWKDWAGTPSGALGIGWVGEAKPPPQMCYENASVRDFARYWAREVIGREVKSQLERLAQAGKPELFAGVIAGWESNLSDGYCSLSLLGYGADRPPADFDHERERVLQRHVELWARGIYEAGIPRERIFTHLTALPRQHWEKISATMSRAQIREMPLSTAFRAYWTAFNDYSSAGFSAYLDEGRFEGIYDAVGAHGSGSWAMAEGTNLVFRPSYPEGEPLSPLNWETYLARNFNHGATLVNIFGGFQGPQHGVFERAAESADALAAYRKFLRGDSLIEDMTR